MNFFKNYFNFLAKQYERNIHGKKIGNYKKSKKRTVINRIFLFLFLFLIYYVGKEYENIEWINFFDYANDSKYQGTNHPMLRIGTNEKFIIGSLVLEGLRRIISNRFLIKKTDEEIEKEIDKKINLWNNSRHKQEDFITLKKHLLPLLLFLVFIFIVFIYIF